MSVTPEELRRQKSGTALRPPDRNILVAVRCFATGRVVPTAKLCVDEQASLRDVIVAWAKGVMSFEGSFLPPGVSALGSEGSLDLEASLFDLKRLLPVLQGRPTISVRWPATAQVTTSVQTAVVAKVAVAKKPKEKAQVSAFVSTKKKAVEKVKVPKKPAMVKEKVAKAKTEKPPKEKKERKEGKRGGKAEENREVKASKRKKVSKASKENQVNGDGEAKATGAGSSSSSSGAASSSSSSDSDDDAIGAITRYLMQSDDEQEKGP